MPIVVLSRPGYINLGRSSAPADTKVHSDYACTINTRLHHARDTSFASSMSLRPGYINLGHSADLAGGADVEAMRQHCWQVLDEAWACGVR